MTHGSDAPKNGHYRTSDMYYAAYLQVAGVGFRGTIKEGTRVFFLFDDSEGMKDLKLQYFSNLSKVAALPYANAIKTMKALTHEAME